MPAYLKAETAHIKTSKKPKAFKNVNMSNIPAHYENHKRAWILIRILLPPPKL